MKKTISLIALLLTLVMLLSACAGSPKDTAGSTGASTTGSTESTANGSAENTTVGTEPEATTPTEAEEKTPAELTTAEDFKQFIQDNRWYWRALGCVFEKPEDIPAYFYFYLGVGETGQFTAEESAFLKAAYEKKYPKGGYEVMSDIKLPVAKINDALSILGVTIEDIKIPDQWVYYDETDSYYFWVSDAYGVDRWSVTKVEKGAEGTVAVYWKMDGIDNGEPSVAIPSRGAKMVMTMQLQSDGAYRILSNVPQA